MGVPALAPTRRARRDALLVVSALVPQLVQPSLALSPSGSLATTETLAELAPSVCVAHPSNTFRGHCLSSSGPHGSWDSPLSDSGNTEAGTADDVDLIVRFHDYRHQHEHEQLLAASVCDVASAWPELAASDWCTSHSGEGALSREVDSARLWKWVERRNAAKQFPTDFGIVRLAASAAATFEDIAKALGAVKDVHVDRKFTLEQFLGPKHYQEVMATLGAEEVGGMGNHSAVEDFPRRRLLWDEGSAEENLASKSPGRRLTRWSFSEEDQEELDSLEGQQQEQQENRHARWGASAGDRELLSGSRSLVASERQVTRAFSAEKLWDQGHSGAGIKTGVFDTGVRENHPHFRNVEERTNWTHENTLDDGLGHGSFVAGVIGSQDSSCPGFAPDARLHAFRVFTNDQISYTSWFLDAFNYAIATEMDIVNLSIGGPDYLDIPFVEKVWEITSNGIIMVSAIGNDGPLYGTLNNPADQADVIGVGGIDYSDKIASFSSRGMSTWELPHGYGRFKPDVVAYGRDVMGSKMQGGCRSLSGTSVASPVVCGAVTLLASTIPEERRWRILNPASMKQALVESASPLRNVPIVEQGAGKINLEKAAQILADYEPRASAIPSKLDLTNCPYMWPFCKSPMYAGAMPLILNVTVMNGMNLLGNLKEDPVWTPDDERSDILDFVFTFSDIFWPWSGFLGMYIRVRDSASDYRGVVSGSVTFTVVSPPAPGGIVFQESTVSIPFKHNVIPTPPRAKRILFDLFHSVRYPPAYIPRDSLAVRNDILDWHGDHPHTNFHGMFDDLVQHGFHVEMLGSPFTCFDASQYGTLLLADAEEEYTKEEVDKIYADVTDKGLHLVVFAEWYHVDTMVKMRFFDDNTRSWWTPATGGANVPALNDLLDPFGISFGDSIYEGFLSWNGQRISFASGTSIIRFPQDGYVHRFSLNRKVQGGGGPTQKTHASEPRSSAVEVPVLGQLVKGLGKVSVYGDSNCLDSSHMNADCFGLLRSMIEPLAPDVKGALQVVDAKLRAPLDTGEPLPTRRTDVDFTEFSKALRGGAMMACGLDTSPPFQPRPAWIMTAKDSEVLPSVEVMSRLQAEPAPRLQATANVTKSRLGDADTDSEMASSVDGTDSRVALADTYRAEQSHTSAAMASGAPYATKPAAKPRIGSTFPIKGDQMEAFSAFSDGSSHTMLISARLFGVTGGLLLIFLWSRRCRLRVFTAWRTRRNKNVARILR